MSGKSAEQIFSGGGDPFVSSDMKRALAEGGVPFGIVGATAKKTGGAYGDETVFVISVSAKAAKAAKSDEIEAGVYQLTLSHTDVRERQAYDVIAAVAIPGSDPVGPCYLGQVPTKNGQRAWAISPEPNTDPIEASDDAPAAAGSDSDDGIPY